MIAKFQPAMPVAKNCCWTSCQTRRWTEAGGAAGSSSGRRVSQKALRARHGETSVSAGRHAQRGRRGRSATHETKPTLQSVALPKHASSARSFAASSLM